MLKSLLKIDNLKVGINGKIILDGLNLNVNEGEIHVIMGPNGAGKSTLGYAVMGHPNYLIEEGTILFEGEDITYEKTDLRAKKGIYLSFQNPEELPGITLENFMKTSKSSVSGNSLRLIPFRKDLHRTMDTLGMNSEYASRYLNVGFSGGEKKKSEILQMLMLEPRLAILDETDSGLDVDAVKVVSKGVKAFKSKKNSLLIITHNTKILEYLKVDYVHILIDGKLVRSGDASLIDEVNANGYKAFTLNRK